jgi:hypothetical protein
MNDWRDIHADQNLRLAQKMLEQQGEINALKATVGRVEKLCDDMEAHCGGAGIDVPHWVTSVRSALAAPESPVTAPTPSTPGAEASEGTGEAQEDSQ